MICDSNTIFFKCISQKAISKDAKPEAVKRYSLSIYSATLMFFVVIAITATVLEYSSVDPRLSLRPFKRHATHIHQLIQEEFSFTITKKVSRLYFLTI